MFTNCELHAVSSVNICNQKYSCFRCLRQTFISCRNCSQLCTTALILSSRFYKKKIDLMGMWACARLFARRRVRIKESSALLALHDESFTSVKLKHFNTMNVPSHIFNIPWSSFLFQSTADSMHKYGQIGDELSCAKANKDSTYERFNDPS